MMHVIWILLLILCVGEDNFTDSAVSARLNGEHKEKDLEPWDGGEQHISGSMESLDTDLVRCQTNQAWHNVINCSWIIVEVS